MRPRRLLRLCRARVELWHDTRKQMVLVAAQPIGDAGQPRITALTASIEALLATTQSTDHIFELDVIAESAWLPLLSIATDGALWSDAQMDALLRHRLGQTYADEATAVSGWDVRVDHRPGEAHAIGYGLDPTIKAAVMQAVAKSGFKLRSMQPSFSWGWQQLRAERRRTMRAAEGKMFWIWYESDRTLAVTIEQGCVVALNPAGTLTRDVAGLARLAQKEALRLGIEVVDPTVFAAGWETVSKTAGPGLMHGPSIDFLHARRAPVIGWCLLALGAAAVTAAAWLYQQREMQRAEFESGMLQREAAQRRAREIALRPKILSADERRYQHIAGQLQQPWLATFRTVEGVTQAPVFLLSLVVDPATGKVQLDAEAPSFDHALAYVQQLSEDGALATAQLVSHESIIDPSGQAAVRFTVSALWSRP